MNKLSTALRLLLWTSAALEPLATLHLRRRLRNGKEHPARWREKLGYTSVPRPPGTLVWMHGVGVGEVMALRGLITMMRAQNPELQFLVTSTALSSAKAWDANPVEAVTHQFLPLDLPAASCRFLDHWKPDLAIWAEQDLWPAFVWRVSKRQIPQAMVNARLNDVAFAKREKVKAIYSDALSCLALIDAQDDLTAANLARLGAKEVSVSGSLKPISPPLSDWSDARLALTDALAGRKLWVCAPSHAEDEAVALAAQKQLGDMLLVIAPRLPERSEKIREAAQAMGLKPVLWSEGAPIAQADVLVADSFGQMGLWYRMAEFALIGGTFSKTEGHNPWEAIALGCPVLHGPRTGNFAQDYNELNANGGAMRVSGAADIVNLDRNTLPERSKAATSLARTEHSRKATLANRLAALIGGKIG